jgi:peptidoglycan/LPS O-acetylase OafA/YrhL
MKKHLKVLDGLRGTAAISVVVFHFQELSVGIENPEALWLKHAYLAVDFFFCLSGYVIGYAYDDRRNRISVLEFFASRLKRLHPLVAMGLLLGLLSYVFDPFAAGTKRVQWLTVQDASLWKLIGYVLAGLLMIPSRPLPSRFGSYFSLNAPTWSLMWEYLANMVFAIVLWRMGRRVLLVVTTFAAVALGVFAHAAGTLDLGFDWGQMLYACVRTAFSFSVGLLLFRFGAAVRTPLGFGSLSVLMVLLFFVPFFRLNWIYDVVVVLGVFPLIVVLGAGAETSGLIGKLCEFAGRISYPIYMVHYAIVMIFANYYWTRRVSEHALSWIIAALTIFAIMISYVVLILYDEPIRRWLNGRRISRNQVASTGSYVMGQE